MTMRVWATVHPKHGHPHPPICPPRVVGCYPFTTAYLCLCLTVTTVLAVTAR